MEQSIRSTYCAVALLSCACSAASKPAHSPVRDTRAEVKAGVPRASAPSAKSRSPECSRLECRWRPRIDAAHKWVRERDPEVFEVTSIPRRPPTVGGCPWEAWARRVTSVAPAKIAQDGCTVLRGKWSVALRRNYYSSPDDVPIEFLISPREAARAGAGRWSKEVWKRFMENPANLYVGYSRKPGGPAAWLPGDLKFGCMYTVRWIEVKATFGLGASASELSALKGAGLRRCDAWLSCADSGDPLCGIDATGRVD